MKFQTKENTDRDIGGCVLRTLLEILRGYILRDPNICLLETELTIEIPENMYIEWTIAL